MKIYEDHGIRQSVFNLLTFASWERDENDDSDTWHLDTSVAGRLIVGRTDDGVNQKYNFTITSRQWVVAFATSAHDGLECEVIAPGHFFKRISPITLSGGDPEIFERDLIMIKVGVPLKSEY
jgi:hypothetical protein